MASISGSTYVELRFDAAGNLANGDAAALAQALAAPKVSDLVMISHGWKFEPPGPRLLYEAIWPNVVTHLGSAGSYVVAGVSWPSKRYTTGIDAATLKPVATGGAAAAGDAGGAPSDLGDAALEDALAAALDGFDDAALAGPLADYLARQDFDAAETLLKAAGNLLLAEGDSEISPDAARLKAFTDDVGAALSIFAPAPVLEPAPEAAQVLGLDLGERLSGLFTGTRAATVRLLEQFSYYEMKARAGVIGRSLGGVLGALAPGHPVRLHLVGHSFGARVVTAAAAALPAGSAVPLRSLTLLQGAFSHNGLSAKRGGAFHRVVGKPSGAITISHTHNDSACTLMYAIASRASGDTTQGFGGPDDRFGAMGANGAQFAAGETMAQAGAAPFRPQAGRINNFRADTFISEHNDIENAEVGKLIAASIRA